MVGDDVDVAHLAAGSHGLAVEVDLGLRVGGEGVGEAGVQVRVEGIAQQVSAEEADAYFASRPRVSQLGAWASHQSREIDSRDALEAQYAEVEARFAALKAGRTTDHLSSLPAPQQIGEVEH